MDSVGESLKGFEARYFRPWPENVYNAKNGGPLTNPVDYFSNETAKKYFKQRVRYFIARWGYSPNILAWQFWGEYDNVILFGEHLIRLPLVKAWHSEMSEYIKSLDSKHLVTSNEALPNNDSTVDDEIWQMNSIDYVTIHSYSDTNIDWVIPKAVASYSRYNKPLVVQEWGYIAEDLANKNPEANNVSWHNVIWQLSFMTAGTPMKFSYRDLTTDYQKIRSILAELWQ
jgi:endo-1,4-beta-mannosidase